MTSSLPEYPQLFAEKLEGNLKLRAAVDASLNVVADILKVSNLPFFTDYTDHGTDHLSRVLEIADKLIPHRSHALFTAEDAAVMIFSVLLHDLALHLNEAGFMSLLNPKKNQNSSESGKWVALWEEFLTVARHWDDRKLVEIFGADELGAPRALVRDPFTHYDSLTESDRKLIGEFIRQHHAHMAYQFAILGFPDNSGQTIQFDSFDPELRELTGIVARSHGLAFRDCFRHLDERQFSRLEQDNAHPVFLMGLLRIADFLDLGTDRAPLVGLAYKEFKSSVSRREWVTNQAFRRISWGNPDPESIRIPAKPEDIHSYLGLRDWLTAIQQELDMTWAVFGEVYAAHPRFAKFGLTIRRVHSNILDDPQGFAKNAVFAPRRVELGVAGADVLKLFIEPLYGKRPEIGIRELIQNAVDAVRERWEFEKSHPGLAIARPTPEEGDVVVWLDDPDDNGVAVLTVTDNGIGMTEEIVADYFLKVGASFRRSIAWKKEFESETGTDETVRLKSRVLRSGRFGIGVLAFFLLADEAEVWTRHITSDRGMRFLVRLDLRPPAIEVAPIQLTYDADLPVGTTIKLKVNKVLRAKVEKRGHEASILGSDIFVTPSSWDWYCLQTPSVVRLQGKERKILTQFASFPPENLRLPRGWRLLQSSDYRTVHALVDGRAGAYLPDLVCNGIKVSGTTAFGGLLEKEPAIIDWQRGLFPGQGVFRLRTPNFSIFDPDGNLPLNLQRTGLTRLDFDFLEDAFAAQAKAALAKFVLSAPVKLTLTKVFLTALSALFEFQQVFPVFFTKIGTALLTATNLRIAQIRNCLLLNSEAFSKDWLTHLLDRYDAVIVARWGSHGSSALYSLNELNPWIATARLVTRSDEEPVLTKPLRFRYKEFSVERFHSYRTGNCPPSLMEPADIETLRDKFLETQNGEDLRSASDLIAAELFLRPNLTSKAPPELSIGHYWEQIIREPIIPFDSTDRLIKLSHAYAVLSHDLAEN